MTQTILGKVDAGSFRIETSAEVFPDGSARIATRVERPEGAPQPDGTRDNSIWLSPGEARKFAALLAKAVA